AGKVFQAGTLSGNPLATAAGYETLQVIDQTPDFYPRVTAAMSRLGAGLQEAAAAAGIHACFTGLGAMGTCFFPPAGQQAPSCWAEASACDTRLFARYFHAMLDRGIYLPCSQFEALFTSIEHTDELVDMTIAAAREVFRSLKD
ncbi:MAG: aminotransferase class III-fold pyridoxal phosphate-dependent enzyme, partial [Thermoguttaceae bacterium]|nr:aminotransferase class III-fold pyridoxal phosphate-dependent enzyme [Thermoguttaceae bacterium]